MKNTYFCVIDGCTYYKYEDFETAKNEANKLYKKGHSVKIGDCLFDDTELVGTHEYYTKGRNGRWETSAANTVIHHRIDAYVGMPVEIAVAPIYEDGRWGKEENYYGKVEEITANGEIYVLTDGGMRVKEGKNEHSYVHFRSKYMSEPLSYCLHVEERNENETTVYRNNHDWKSYYTKEAALNDLKTMQEGYQVLAAVNITSNKKKQFSCTADEFIYEEFVEYTYGKPQRTVRVKAYVR